MEDKNIRKTRKRETSEEKIINNREERLIAVKIQMYWLAWRMLERIRYRLLKPGFKSNSEITDRRQRIVGSIFGELKLMKTLYVLKSIPHLMNQINLYQEEMKTQSQNTVQNCRDTR